MKNVIKLVKNDLEEKLRTIRTERYLCQSVAKKALPKEKVSMCLRRVNGNSVSVHKHIKTDKAFYGGLMVCGRVWQCPVCAAKISERRKKELEQAFQIHKADGGKLAMLTLTFSHKKHHKLKDLLEKFGQATQKFMSGKRYQKIRDKMNLIGRVRVFEVTYGDNGFHPHAHIALFYYNDVDLDKIRIEMYELWESACEKFGLKTNFKNGLHLETSDTAEEYLSKHGTWSLEQELSKSHIKKAKEGSLSPFDFLRKYLITEEEGFLHLFREYAECFKGKRQIQWSQGLKKRFIIVDKTDEDLAKEKTEDADQLGMLSFEDWKQILKYESRTIFLDRVEKYGFNAAYAMTLKKESSCIEDSRSVEI